MGFRALATILILLVTGASCASPPQAQSSRVPASYTPWQFAVISDIHVYPSGRVAPEFKQLVSQLVALKPRLVIITGDSTNGNLDDDATPSEVQGWWSALESALAPLRTAGIPILPIAGNHDYYREVHRQGYLDAWSGLAASVAPITVSGNAPRFYSFEVDDVHFSMLHVVDQKIDADVLAWLKQDLSSPAAVDSRLRFAFGHVPLKSVMGHTDAAFRRKLGSVLNKGNVQAYIAAHEHLVWDETLQIAGKPLRQITVGTASGTYNFPLNVPTYSAHCHGARCTLPYSGKTFELEPHTRRERDQVTMLLVNVVADGYTTRFMALDPAGRLGAFGEE